MTSSHTYTQLLEIEFYSEGRGFTSSLGRNWPLQETRTCATRATRQVIEFVDFQSNFRLTAIENIYYRLYADLNRLEMSS
jgi:hypothetical protein